MLNQINTQKQTQNLLPKIILQQNILALPALALDNIIKRELEMNPLLEEESDTDLDENVTVNDLSEADKKEDLNPISEDDVNYESEKEKNTDEEYNWDEYFENEEPDGRPYEHSNNSEYENIVVSEEGKSLKDSLFLQLHLSSINKKRKFIGEEIIWSLNDEGYFTDKDEDIIKDLNIKKLGTEFEGEDFKRDELDDTLNYIQKKLDPPGIAARNLKECLLIQVDRSNKDKEIKNLASVVIKNFFDELRLKKYEKIGLDLNIDMQKVKEIFDFIHNLNPKPGYDDEVSRNDYIIPDLIIKKIDDDYDIVLNEKYSPAIRISKTYRDLYTAKKSKLDDETREYLMHNFNKARWFIDAINSRRETLVKIMRAIINRQRYYFDNNDSGLKPMFEKEIAEEIMMDSSTISRAVRGKYVQTDSGIHELRSFFTTPVSKSEGGDVSISEAKITLKMLIDKENKIKPLSDKDLAEEMKKLGFNIARRTISKYRESLNIPMAKQRREI